ncbi:MAG: hypothetical protein JW942_00420 [Opitutales bacterium]|nr:hypothetical protein [Opitutales bacterium]
MMKNKILPTIATLAAALAALALAACNTESPSNETQMHRDDGKIKGFAVPAWRKGEFRSPDYAESTRLIKALGANYISIHSTFYQDTMRGTEIFDRNNEQNSAPDIEEQRKAVQVAHASGLKVMLKPHVNLRSGEGWRGDIGKGMTEEEVDAWFRSYGSLLLAHARMAEEEGVEMLCVGTELSEAQPYSSHWRELIAKVREVYKGPLVYAANHYAEFAMDWWDAVDYIGIDAYYKLADKNDPTVDELIAAWEPWVKIARDLHEKYGKQVIYTEIGYTSVDGTAQVPFSWELTNGLDYQEQKDCYEAFFRAVYVQPWFEGVIFWSWRIHRDVDSESAQRDFTPENKPAEGSVRHWFSGAWQE